MLKWTYYLRYFIFIAFNWNPKLAWFTLLSEIKGEKKYQLDTVRMNNLHKLTLKGSREHAEVYQAANYFLIEHLLQKLKELKVSGHILDMGCGKGRVMAVSAYYKFNKISGVEFAKELCDDAIETMAILEQRFPQKLFKVYYENALNYAIPDDVNVIFFFNPFNEVTMLQVVKNIMSSHKINYRNIYIVYINPLHKEIFLSAGFKEVYFFEKYYYIQGSILKLSSRL